MKTTDHFKETIKAHLDQRAAADELFARSYAKDGKNLDDCVTYILNTVQASGYAGFTDEEVYSMAVHYYDEDGIDVGKPIKCNVVVNHSIELTEDEKQAAYETAKQKAIDEAYLKMTGKPEKKSQPKTEAPQAGQQSLF